MGVAGDRKGIPESLFDDIADPSLVHVPLTRAEVGSVMAYGQQQPGGSPGARSDSEAGITQLNISALSPEQVRAFLTNLPIPEEWVRVVWPYERKGVRMRYLDFVRHYDSLWYPSRDDVWLTSEQQGWFLELDHEEIVRFVPRGAEGQSRR
jgi:hypothetical protein